MSAFGLYGLATDLAGPVIGRVLARRCRAGKEVAERLPERLGHASRPRPAGPLIWAHAASVGESLSLLPLIDGMLVRVPDAHVLVTTGTVTSAKLMAGRLPARCCHQFVPVDQRRAVRRFLDHWRPDLALFVESELWPNLILETRARSVPMILVNARMSARSFRTWRRWKALAAPLFRGFALALAQDAEQASRLDALGTPHVVVLGDLKAAGPPPPADAEVLADLRRQLGPRPVWLAASTHPGEEAWVIAAHIQARKALPGLLTILAPRHPVRADAVAAEIARAGLHLVRRTGGGAVEPDTDMLLVDTLGELGFFYRLAPVVLIAGSLGGEKPMGGHNPLEAARLGCAILHGPDMINSASATAALDQAGATRIVDSAEALGLAVVDLLSDAGLARRMGAAAAQVAADQAGVLDRALAALEPFLATLSRTPA